MVANFTRTRHEFHNDTVFSLDTLGPGEYFANMLIKGNSILSTLTVTAIDPGATLEVQYIEFTTQQARDAGQEIFLEAHDTVDDTTTLPFVDKITITRIHSTPRIRVVVTGGNATFEVHNTVVQSFASDLDAALVQEDEAFVPDRTKGIPIAGYDPADGAMNLVRVVDGVLQVSSSDEVINKRLYNESISLSPSVTYTEHINYTVPAGKRFRWIAGFGSGNNNGKWRVTIDGSTYLIKRNAFDQPNVELALQRGLSVSAGQNIVVEVRNANEYNTAGDYETGIYGIEETI